MKELEDAMSAGWNTISSREQQLRKAEEAVREEATKLRERESQAEKSGHELTSREVRA